MKRARCEEINGVYVPWTKIANLLRDLKTTNDVVDIIFDEGNAKPDVGERKNLLLTHHIDDEILISIYERASEDETIVIRSILVSRVPKDGRSAYDIVSCFSVSKVAKDNKENLWNDGELDDIEFQAVVDGISFFRQIGAHSSNRIIKSVCLLKQRFKNSRDAEIFQKEVPFSDWLRGGSLFLDPVGSGILSIRHCDTITLPGRHLEQRLEPKQQHQPSTWVQPKPSIPQQILIPPQRSLTPPLESGITTPADYWFRLASAENLTAAQLHHRISVVLSDYCFSSECSTQTFPVLQMAMPVIEEKLVTAKSHQRRLKLAKEAALEVGFNAIKTMAREQEERLIFEAAISVLLYFHPEILQLTGIKLYANMEEFAQAYPDMMDADHIEIRKLFHYANFMKICTVLLQARGHGAHLMDLVTKICEGRGVKYICGGGQTMATARRKMILEREGGLKATGGTIKQCAAKILTGLKQSALKEVKDAEAHAQAQALALAQAQLLLPIPVPGSPSSVLTANLEKMTDESAMQLDTMDSRINVVPLPMPMPIPIPMPITGPRISPDSTASSCSGFSSNSPFLRASNSTASCSNGYPTMPPYARSRPFPSHLPLSQDPQGCYGTAPGPYSTFHPMISSIVDTRSSFGHLAPTNTFRLLTHEEVEAEAAALESKNDGSEGLYQGRDGEEHKSSTLDSRKGPEDAELILYFLRERQCST